MSGIFKGVKRGARRASFEAERMVRIERVQGQIGALDGQLRGAMTRLGHLTYELARRGEITHPELQQFCAQLDGLRAQITAHEAEIESMRKEAFVEETGVVYCTHCGAACASVMLFCACCGMPLQVAAPPPDSPPPAGPPSRTTGSTTCPHCAAANAPSALACAHCGHALPTQIQIPAPVWASQSSPRRMASDVGLTAPSPRQA